MLSRCRPDIGGVKRSSRRQLFGPSRAAGAISRHQRWVGRSLLPHHTLRCGPGMGKPLLAPTLLNVAESQPPHEVQPTALIKANQWRQSSASSFSCDNVRRTASPPVSSPNATGVRPATNRQRRQHHAKGDFERFRDYSIGGHAGRSHVERDPAACSISQLNSRARAD